MKQRLFILLALIFLLIALVGLNAASYVQKEKIPDSEETPNRSTYNAGATGTRAFYDLLAETGRDVLRWQEPFPANGVFDPEKFSTFVIIGRTRRELKDDQIKNILNWVSNGGTLVIIDREPSPGLIATTSYWDITRSTPNLSPYATDPSDQKQMVGESEAVKPQLPSILTSKVNAVQPSQFASSITITRLIDGDKDDQKEDDDAGSGTAPETSPPPTEPGADDGIGSDAGNANTADEEPFEVPVVEEAGERTATSLFAPVIHLANKDKNLLVDFPFGDGQIIHLSDPYIIANGGIKLVDNAQAGINVVASRGGRIAFDEYHQGYGNNENRLLGYFSGTPLVAIFLQLGLIIGLLFYSQSRRFARALPENEPDRLSKLEYVSAMAQLQQQTKAFDLAVENIYGDFRRRVARLVGVDNKHTTREVLAEKISERTGRNEKELEDLFYKCEDIMHGEPTGKKEIVKLTGSLREIENELGLGRGGKRGSV